MNDAEILDCPPCKADGFEVCDHTEGQRIIFRERRAAENRAKKRRQRSNARADRRAAFESGNKWV